MIPKPEGSARENGGTFLAARGPTKVMEHRSAAWQARERLARLAWLLDSSIPIPGTRFSIGLEALIGLFPVVGDLVGVFLSSYIVRGPRRLPKHPCPDGV